MENHISLNELLVKTSYLTQITEPSDKDFARPIGFGSGFIVEYDSANFFVTADHTIHVDDYNGEKEERTWKDYRISIFNNYSDPHNFLSTAITPLAGFYYMEQFHLNKLEDLPKPVDVAVCKMHPINFQYPFLTDRVSFANGEIIDVGEQKLILRKECFSDPVTNKSYFIFGKIRTRLVDGIRMEWQNTLKVTLHFVQKTGDFYLLNTTNIITDKKEWEGLSGSAVISEDGKCIGVLCYVRENSRSIWVMPISKVRMLIDVILQEEQLLESE